MSDTGQTEKNSVGANVFCYTLKLVHRFMQSARLANQDVDGRVKPRHVENQSKKAPPGGGDPARPWGPVAISPRNDEFDQQNCPTRLGQDSAPWRAKAAG